MCTDIVTLGKKGQRSPFISSRDFIWELTQGWLQGLTLSVQKVLLPFCGPAAIVGMDQKPLASIAVEKQNTCRGESVCRGKWGGVSRTKGEAEGILQVTFSCWDVVRALCAPLEKNSCVRTAMTSFPPAHIPLREGEVCIQCLAKHILCLDVGSPPVGVPMLTNTSPEACQVFLEGGGLLPCRYSYWLCRLNNINKNVKHE